MIEGALPLLKGWKPYRDLRMTTYALTPGQVFDLIPYKKTCGWGTFVTMYTNQKDAEITFDTEDLKYALTPYQYWITGLTSPNPLGWVGVYNDTFALYNVNWGLFYPYPQKDYIHVYITAPTKVAATGIAITTNTKIYASGVFGIEITEPSLLKSSLHELYGTKTMIDTLKKIEAYMRLQAYGRMTPKQQLFIERIEKQEEKE